MANMSFTNNAATTLASGITNVATSLTVATGTGALFPTLTGGQYFYCTLQNTAGTTVEIVKVTARTTDTFTIVRGQDNTTGTAFVTGDKVELRLVAAELNLFPKLDEANTFTGLITASGGVAGAVNGTVGATTPNTGAFTTLSASSTVSGTGFSTYLASPPAIGGTAAAAITGTTITGNTSVSSPVISGTNGLIINSKAVATSYSIPSTSSAMSAGPITLNAGVAVTVPSGSKWVIL